MNHIRVGHSDYMLHATDPDQKISGLIWIQTVSQNHIV